MRILISGASVAGPVLAYWLRHYGFSPTVIERSATLRKTGGHAVDLFRPAVEIVERMGVRPRIEARKTGTEWMTMVGDRIRQPIEVETRRMMSAMSDKHVEIMRDDLSEIFYDVTKDDVEYVFGDSIAGLHDDGGGVDVTFETGRHHRFDLVIGADGLHSNVRRLAFGEESLFTAYIGSYLGVISLPNYLELDGRMIVYGGAGRMAGIYSAQHLDQARAIFLFRSAEELDYHHRDVSRQKELLKQYFADLGWDQMPRLTDEIDRTTAFYFDSISQVRMDSWSRGRVSLVGDAGYSPGPAVGGGTSLAVVGAYVLAGRLAAAGGDHVRGFRGYEAEMGDFVRHSRSFGLGAVKKLIPDTPLQMWALAQAARLVTRIPAGLIKGATRLAGSGIGLHDTFTVQDYSNGERNRV